MTDAARPALRIVGFVAWAIAVLLAAEGAVRAAGWVLRRDQVVASTRPGARVVYAIGDSFTYGQGVKREQAWPQLLATRLRADDGVAAPEVRTLAEPGRSSSVALLEVAKALKAGDARLVLVLTGWNANDGDFAKFAAEHDQAVPWTVRADLFLSHSRLYRVLKHAATYRSRTLVLDEVEVVPQRPSMQLYDFRAYQLIARANLELIARMCHAAGVPCVFLTYPHQELPPNPYTPTEYYHALFGRTPLSEEQYVVQDRRAGEIAIDAIIREVGASAGVPVIDLQPGFDASERRDLFLSDWHHPTVAGHAIIAETVYAGIRDGLRPR